MDDEVDEDDDDVEVVIACEPSPAGDENDVVVEEPSPNPFSPSFVREVLRMQPSELPRELRDRAYNFCKTTTVANLRRIARVVNAPTQGAKASLSTIFFSETWMRVAALPVTERLAEWHRCCGHDGIVYRDWLESPRVQTRTWWRAPSEDLLSQYCPIRSKKVARTAKASECPRSERTLNVSEFARLACILTEYEEAKYVLLDSMLDLTRAQLDRSESRDAFWSNTISPLFNNATVLVSFVPPLELSDISPNQAPITVRSAYRLMESWTRTRSVFTCSYERWSASGQNDPTNFRLFVPAAPGGGDLLPVDSRRALVLFYVLRCGTRTEDTTVLDCVRRTSRAPYDDLEARDPKGNWQGKGGGSSSGKKRKYCEDDGGSSAFLEGARCLANAISAPQSESTSAHNDVGSAAILETSRLIEEYSRLLVLLRDARSGSAEKDYTQILETQVLLAKDRIRISQKREQEKNSAAR